MNPPFWLEVWYWWSQILLTAIALATAVFAAIQVRLLLAARRAEERLARAEFLMDLDRRWESPDMVAARTAVRDLERHALAESRTKHPNLSANERLSWICAEWLAELRNRDYPEYQKFMQLWGLMETLGYLYAHDYLSLAEIDGLFGYSINQFDLMCRRHLEQRDREASNVKGSPAGLYEHARRLATDIRMRSA